MDCCIIQFSCTSFALQARLSQLTFAKRFCQIAGSRKRKYLMAGGMRILFSSTNHALYKNSFCLFYSKIFLFQRMSVTVRITEVEQSLGLVVVSPHDLARVSLQKKMQDVMSNNQRQVLMTACTQECQWEP